LICRILASGFIGAEPDPDGSEDAWKEEGVRVDDKIELCVGSIDSLSGPLSIDLCGPACRSVDGRGLCLRGLSGPADAKSASMVLVGF